MLVNCCLRLLSCGIDLSCIDLLLLSYEIFVVLLDLSLLIISSLTIRILMLIDINHLILGSSSFDLLSILLFLLLFKSWLIMGWCLLISNLIEIWISMILITIHLRLLGCGLDQIISKMLLLIQRRIRTLLSFI